MFCLKASSYDIVYHHAKFEHLLQVFLFYFFLNLFLANDTCSASETSFIIGGKVLTDRVYPWAGVFFYKEIPVCGGNLSKYLSYRQLA